MAKPIIKQLKTFDATVGSTAYFVWTGFMAYNNRMIIYDASTMNVVYDNTYDENHYTLDHAIPAKILTNGKKYAVSIAVLDINKTESTFSDKYYFTVSKTPTFYLKDLSTSTTLSVQNASYTAELVYSQADNVAIDTYSFSLYNSVKERIFTSDVYKGAKSSFKCTFNALANNSVYYISATGSTVQGVTMSTGLCPISVNYQEPSFYSVFYTTPNPIIGTVDYTSNMIDIESDLPSKDYRFEDGFVDLTKEPNSVRYSKNFTIPKNFTLSVRMKNVHKTCNVLKAQKSGEDLWLLRAIYDEDTKVFRFKLIVYGNTSDYIIYSDSLDFTNYDIVTLHIRRINGIYGLYPFITKSSVVVIDNQWFVDETRRISNNNYTFIGDKAHAETWFVEEN